LFRFYYEVVFVSLFVIFVEIYPLFSLFYFFPFPYVFLPLFIFFFFFHF